MIEMYEYSEDLNYEISEKNYIKELQELFSDSECVNIEHGNDINSLNCRFNKKLRDKTVKICVCIEFDDKILYRIKLTLEPIDEDTTNYEMDLKLFYFEEIKGYLLDAVNKSKDKFTLRVYKIIYNSLPIYGYYKVNGSNKILFHTLDVRERDEPLTEHVICFDIEVMERSFERAKSLANNIISDFSSYLSVFLDIGFHEPVSKYMNFVQNKHIGGEILIHEKYRTAFYDNELELYVKDNLNGISTKEDIKKGNYNNGYYSLSSLYGANTMQLKIGDLNSVKDAFGCHRLYKVEEILKDKKVSGNEKPDEVGRIDEEIHFPNQPIYISYSKLRKYIRGIEKYKNDNYERFLVFRSACRLYNKSKVLSIESASIEVSFLVACIETLSKSEENQSFTEFVMKYNKEANKNDLDSMYGIRSKLFHAGYFSFFEYEFDVNPYSNPLYLEFNNKYILFKSILRKAFINWINEHIINDQN